MDFERVTAVFKLVADLDRFGGEFPGLAYRNETGVQPICQRWSEDKSTRLHSEDEVDFLADVVRGERVNQAREAEFVFKKRSDVVEEDARLRKIGNFANQLLQAFAIDWFGRHLLQIPGCH